MTRSGRILFSSMALLLGVFASWTLSSWAGSEQLIFKGMKVDVGYTCRFKADGPIVAATSPDIIADEGNIKSSLFQPPGKPGPVSILAGEQNIIGTAVKQFVLNFEEYIQEAIARILPGMSLNTAKTVTLVMEPQRQISETERILKISRVWKRPRKVTATREYFEARYPVAAEIGNAVPIFTQELKCEITAVDDESVSYLCRPLKEDGPLMTAYGPATFKETEEGYDMVLDPEVGDLIRTAGMIGRISSVGDKIITIDYTEPFGGNELICEIKITEPERVKDAVDTQSQIIADAKDVSKSITDALNDEILEAGQALKLSPDTVEQGDLVIVEYTAALKDGSLIQTTNPAAAEDENVAKAESFNKESVFGPEPVIAGKEAGFKGVGQAVLNMKKGQSKQIILTPREAFGEVDPSKIVEIPRLRSYQKEVSFDARDFVRQFDAFPQKDDVFDINPYVEGVISEVVDKMVLIRLRPKMSGSEETFGNVSVQETDDAINIILEPKLGADFQMDDQNKGRIVSVDEDGFEVNFNHFLAGKEIVLDLLVTGLTKKADILSQELEWIADHDDGLKQAKEKKIPMVLVFYSTTCHWCEKLLAETMTDPRITDLNGEYVWVKLDADLEKDLADKYELTSMPLTLLFTPEGDVLKRLSGYRNAADMIREMKSSRG